MGRVVVAMFVRTGQLRVSVAVCSRRLAAVLIASIVAATVVFAFATCTLFRHVECELSGKTPEQKESEMVFVKTKRSLAFTLPLLLKASSMTAYFCG